MSLLSPQQIQSPVLESHCQALNPDYSHHCCCFLVPNKVIFVVPKPSVSASLCCLFIILWFCLHDFYKYLFNFYRLFVLLQHTVRFLLCLKLSHMHYLASLHSKYSCKTQNIL